MGLHMKLCTLNIPEGMKTIEVIMLYLSLHSQVEKDFKPITFLS